MADNIGSISEKYKEGELSRHQPRHSDLREAVVLIVEDEPGIRQLLKTILKRHVKQIFEAKNGQEGVDLCREHPEITVVLMDVKMPVMSGLEATRIIKSFRKELPVIVVTAYALADDRASAMNAGCDDFLVKPFKADELLQKISEHGI